MSTTAVSNGCWTATDCSSPLPPTPPRHRRHCTCIFAPKCERRDMKNQAAPEMAYRYEGAGANASAPNRSLKPTDISVVATVLGLLILLYGYSLFANISYPLFWADESVTAVGAERVLQFGYPKVHDGKNVLYDIKHDDPTLGVDKKTDAYIGGAGWGHYYFAAPFVYLAESFSDIYSKTWLLRVPFAIVGT